MQNRLFWTVSLLAFTGIMLYFVATTISTYFDYPVRTLVSIDEDTHQTFPAVTICNHSPIRFDRFIGPFLQYTNSRNITNTNDSSVFTPLQAEYVDEFLRSRLNANQSVEEFFYSLESLLISCTYNLLNCSSADFVPFISAHYGRCYTFNGKTDRIRNGTVFWTTTNGDHGKLTLRLYTHSHQHIPHYSDGRHSRSPYCAKTRKWLR